MEDKVYPVPSDWTRRAFVDQSKYNAMYDASIRDPDGFWREHGNRIEWFTRVETPGDNAQSASNDVQWVKATVSPHNPGVFSFEQVVVEPNFVSYTP